MNSATQTASSIHLQSVGECSAKPASEFTPGEKMMWNFGYTSTVVAVEDTSRCFLTFILKGDESGLLSSRRMKKSRLVAFPA